MEERKRRTTERRSDEEHRDDRSTTGSVLPLIADAGDGERLAEWLEASDGYEVVDPVQPLAEASFDLCIVDADAFEANLDALRTRKAAAEPEILPYLLLVPERTSAAAALNRGQLADDAVRGAVDEVVSMPVTRVELEWRVETLLRLRSQSLDLSRRREQLRRFKRASEAAGYAIYITDPEGTIEYVNPTFEEVTGYDAAEAIGETPALTRSGRMSEAYYQDLWETITGGDVWEEEIVNRRRDGECYHALQTIAPITDRAGHIDGFVALQTDISEKVELQNELRSFEEIVERIDDPIMLQDLEGRFRVVNEAVVDYAGTSREELVGADEFAFMDDATAAEVERMKRLTLAEERAVSYTVTPTFPPVGQQTFSTLRYPHYDEAGELDGSVAICRNVTERKEREHQLQVLDRVLRHNLRNRLNVIEGSAELVRASASDEVAADAERIVEASEKLSGLAAKQRQITTLLSDPPRLTTLDVAAVVRTVVADVRERYPDGEMTVDLPAECRVTATHAVGQAVGELLENAFEHADRDRPSVDVRVERDADATRIVVADDGPGIPEMERRILTDDVEVDPLYHGSGLGLWFVSLAVGHSNGTLRFGENDPRGSVVTIELPTAS
jgi:PAS domain S-box-containing protein